MRARDWALSLADTIRHATPGDDELADVIADLKEAERVLADTRKMLQSEVTGPLEGRDYALVESRRATRSYNDSALLQSFWQGDLNETLHELMAADVVRLSWQWSKLERLADRRDVSLRIAKHEVSDGDEEHVGENWTTSYDVRPRRNGNA